MDLADLEWKGKLAVGAGIVIVLGGAIFGAYYLEKSSRQDAVSNEADARQAGDTTLQAALDKEVAGRNTAVNAIADARQKDAGANAVAFNAETVARKQGDTDTLNAAQVDTDKKLAVEIANRQAAMDDEVTARQQGNDKTLASAKTYTDGSVAAEITARQAAQATLQATLNTGLSGTAGSANAYTDQKVATEATARQAGVAGVQSALTAETAARTQGDTATLAAANTYTNSKITGFQFYTVAPGPQIINFADVPNPLRPTLTCTAGDIAISGGIVYDPNTLLTGAPATQTSSGVISSGIDPSDTTNARWFWQLRNTDAAPKSFTVSLLCMKLPTAS
ncbi:MAG: hypothetical protein HY261_01570 [Chloroflexi bacterium]|nr:hypothetical protein [Chloroflexota bacterium]